ncbi:MAG: serine protease [Acidobacteriota bacterium]
MKWISSAAILMLVVVPAFGTEVGSEVVSGQLDPAAHAHAMHELNSTLLTLEAPDREALVAPLPVEEQTRLEKAPKDQGRLLVGSNIALGLKVNSASEGGFGQVLRRAEGDVWSAAVRSPGAIAVRLHLGDLDLPKGAELYAYNASGQAFGPYTGRGPLGDGSQWTHTLLGDEIRLQLHLPPRARGNAASAGASFTVKEIAHLGPNFFLAQTPEASAFCGFNQACTTNAACESIPSAIQPAADATAHLLFAVGSSSFICSGGLLNDTDTSTQVPLLLTANHCFSSGSSANSLEAYFQYTTPCGGACFNPYSASLPRTVGSTILSTSSSSDYTLVELAQQPPAGSVLLGWTATAVANSAGTNLFRISHPGGAPQAYSEHSVNTTAGTCGSWPRGPWIYSDDTLGATEGGSSGSVVLNSSGQVVGQLSGACGLSPETSCDGDDRTVDGALAAYYSSVEPFLDPGSGGPSGSCPAGYTEFNGTISAGNPDQVTNIFRDSGNFNGLLICSGADLDLYLDRMRSNGSYRSTVASSTSSGCNEVINYTNNRLRYYRWRVSAYSGSASFTLCVNKP